jgi:ectoine hydroxylase-related dioxygenase (phytanoyl-CoA dioxygenase family)
VASQTYRRAPAGFTESAWRQLDRDGYLVLPDVLTGEEVAAYREAIDRCCASDPEFDPDRYYTRENVVELEPVLTELVDHPRHVGYAYDLYGEQTKVHQSQLFVRPPHAEVTEWHRDGARALPYGLFAPRLPFHLKVGYWLTDQSEEDMANLVVLPGSHRHEHLDQYTTHEPAPGERQLCFPAGTMTLMHCSLWHRVAPNRTARAVRKNLYISYCPSWITAADRVRSSRPWVETLSRERRILMRDYDDSYAHAKPPREDFPLFLDRESGSDRDPGAHRDEVPLHLRRRRVTVERWL